MEGDQSSNEKTQAKPPFLGKGMGVGINICRLVLALTFILSGFVKAVDPLGTQYKINDYLTAWGMGQWLPDLVTLGLSVALSATEFCLGIFLLFAIRRRFTSRAILAILVVMTPLTLWLALTDPISDCGCFGDAIVLTNWQTFWKNVVLLLAAIVVVRRPMAMFRFVSESNQWIVINYTALFILAISVWSLYYLPQFDFRPYHIGANIPKGMEIPEGEEQPRFETTYVMERNGQRQEMSEAEYMKVWEDSTWTCVETKTRQTSKGYVPPIHDFSLTEMETGDDLTDMVLSDPGYTFLLISPHLEHADDSQLDRINQIYEYSREQGYQFYGMTASGETAVAQWRDMTGAEYPFCNTDEITLKTIIRSNPGLVLLKGGTVIRKWSHNDLPDEEQLTAPLERQPLGHMPEDTAASKIATILLWFVLPLMLLTIADRTWMWTRWVRKMKNEK